MLADYAFKAPEIGIGHFVDVKSDIFSLGLVLYFMIKKRLPKRNHDDLKFSKHYS